jgi:hypothetical protein
MALVALSVVEQRLAALRAVLTGAEESAEAPGRFTGAGSVQGNARGATSHRPKWPGWVDAAT